MHVSSRDHGGGGDRPRVGAAPAWPPLAAVGAALLALAAILLVSSSRSDGVQRERATKPAVDRFLDGYVEPDGRVVRRDQGGDTVSEGQAYAMLLTAAIGDRERFELVWQWTRENLQRPDRLLSWLWRDGGVADPQPATDADLDAAHALLVAAERFREPGYRAEARRIGRGILAQEAARTKGTRVMVAGPWARAQRPHAVNPSYFSPLGLRRLARGTGEYGFAALARTGYRHASKLIGNPLPLPPDWAQAAGPRIEPTPGPDAEQGEPRYGFDAARIPLRLAAACEARTRGLAAELWPFFRREEAEGGITAAYALDGETLDATPAPVALVGAAGAADAAGADEDRDRLLDQAQGMDLDNPTYYGAAWGALGRVMLTTDLLGRC